MFFFFSFQVWYYVGKREKLKTKNALETATGRALSIFLSLQGPLSRPRLPCRLFPCVHHIYIEYIETEIPNLTRQLDASGAQ